MTARITILVIILDDSYFLEKRVPFVYSALALFLPFSRRTCLGTNDRDSFDRKELMNLYVINFYGYDDKSDYHATALFAIMILFHFYRPCRSFPGMGSTGTSQRQCMPLKYFRRRMDPSLIALVTPWTP